MKIELLKYHPEFAKTITQWIFSQWGDGTPETFQKKLRRTRRRIPNEDIPLIFAAIDNGECIGTVSLYKQDFEGLTLTPWLAALYVVPERREKGVGKKLVDAAKNKAAELGEKTLYLQTQHKTAYYQKLGWKVYKSTRNKKGQPTDIMYFDL